MTTYPLAGGPAHGQTLDGDYRLGDEVTVHLPSAFTEIDLMREIQRTAHYCLTETGAFHYRNTTRRTWVRRQDGGWWPLDDETVEGTDAAGEPQP